MDFREVDELIMRGALESALERLWDLQDEDPSSPGVDQRIGDVYFQSGRHHDAIEHYEAAAAEADSAALRARIDELHAKLWAPHPSPVHLASEWVEVPGTDAQFRHCCIEREGVRVLVVWLRGSVSRYGDEVATLTEALDAFGARVGDRAEVSVLVTTGFTNADGDECATLTGVFPGLPCCWVDDAWATQDEAGRLWEVPRLAWLRPSEGQALDRVIGLRKEGRFEEVFDERSGRTGEWTERGLLLTETTGGTPTMTSLMHHNRLVERVILGRGPINVVQWPFPDALGTPTEALRCRARVRFVGDRLVEIDLNPWQTGRPAEPDWHLGLDDVDTLEELVLLDVPATDDQVIGVLASHPGLQRLRLDGTKVTMRTFDAIAKGAGPSLQYVNRYRTEVSREDLAPLARLRPGLRLA